MILRNNKFWMFVGSWFLGSTGLATYKYLNTSGYEIVMGNYSDYMAPDLVKKANDEYKIYIDNFTHDQVVKEKFKQKIYDMAVVSTSILNELRKENLVKEIQWNKLNLTKKSDSTSISTKEQAKEIFTDVVQEIYTKENDLFKYGIPYFMNKLSFCYSGAKIESLSSKVSWSDLLATIDSEERFRPKDGVPRVVMIDDPRTIFSMSRLVAKEEDINPDSSENLSFEKFFDTYSKIFDIAKGLKFLLASDPGILVDSLASGTVSGGFMYNGDCLYVASGGNVNNAAQKDQFHIVEMDKDIYFLDFVVLSSSISDSQETKIYNFLSDLLFKGHNETDPLVKEDSSESEYKYSPIKNFAHVQYTPTVKVYLDKIKVSYFDTDLKEIKQKILEINKPVIGVDIKKYYESAFDARVKSDMLIAFEKFKLHV